MKIPTRDLLSMAPMVLCAPLAAGQDCGPPQAITTGEDGPGPVDDTDLDGVGKASAPPAASEENGLRYGWLSFFSGEWEADSSGRGGAHWFFGGTIPIVERL